MIVCIPAMTSGGRNYVSLHFGKAPYFAFYEVSDTGFKQLSLERNPFATMGSGSSKGQAIARYLVSKGVEAVIAYEVGPGAFQHLRDHGIRVFVVEKTLPIEEALKLFIEGALTEAKEPVERD
ncbi:NifB/NifX family molybdenum-iron cluster-binding protein [Desulfurococcus mucosus]|uniref:Dinitrogenase iron-molybdenum cofactor biosynthesis protein n=1 Tax=Desulfurococcus mucosus (strain ATCC 35584 / DSM 2162 / JCM 9187 / O7/1) TaxID=765177 RepID=E8R7N4_DESM0|nr:NifB/NifX family molybdenum-iron cluster-binding protein [Desulfurococcus mucosus]ADV64529.1 Dinitrogenase iron-molybdenum cofactor biosynthesis protein [Desulfurococcus mucosus DSM 2162]